METKLKRYKLNLSNGRVSNVTAKTRMKAKEKYYGSASHFKSEAFIRNIKVVSKPKRRKVRRSQGFGFGSFKF